MCTFVAVGCEAVADVRDSCKVSELSSIETDDMSRFEGEYFVHAISRNSGNVGSGRELSAYVQTDNTLYVSLNCTYTRYE